MLQPCLLINVCMNKSCMKKPCVLVQHCVSLVYLSKSLWACQLFAWKSVALFTYQFLHEKVTRLYIALCTGTRGCSENLLVLRVRPHRGFRREDGAWSQIQSRSRGFKKGHSLPWVGGPNLRGADLTRVFLDDYFINEINLRTYKTSFLGGKARARAALAVTREARGTSIDGATAHPAGLGAGARFPSTAPSLHGV